MSRQVIITDNKIYFDSEWIAKIRELPENNKLHIRLDRAESRLNELLTDICSEIIYLENYIKTENVKER